MSQSPPKPTRSSPTPQEGVYNTTTPPLAWFPSKACNTTASAPKRSARELPKNKRMLRRLPLHRLPLPPWTFSCKLPLTWTSPFLAYPRQMLLHPFSCCSRCLAPMVRPSLRPFLLVSVLSFTKAAVAVIEGPIVVHILLAGVAWKGEFICEMSSPLTECIAGPDT